MTVTPPPPGQPVGPPPEGSIPPPPPNPYAGVPAQPADPYPAAPAQPQPPQYGAAPQYPQQPQPQQPPQYGQPQPQPYGAQPQYGAPPPQQQYGYQGPPPGGWCTDPDDAPRPGVGPKEALRLFFRKYARFTGRASRSEFWWPMLLLSLALIVVYIIAWIPLGIGIGMEAAASSGTSYGASSGGGVALMVLGGVIMGLCVLASWAVIIPSIAVMWRRLHDAGFSGLFYLLSLAGLGIVPLIMCVFESKPEGQRYDRVLP